MLLTLYRRRRSSSLAVTIAAVSGVGEDNRPDKSCFKFAFIDVRIASASKHSKLFSRGSPSVLTWERKMVVRVVLPQQETPPCLFASTTNSRKQYLRQDVRIRMIRRVSSMYASVISPISFVILDPPSPYQSGVIDSYNSSHVPGRWTSLFIYGISFSSVKTHGLLPCDSRILLR